MKVDSQPQTVAALVLDSDAEFVEALTGRMSSLGCQIESISDHGQLEEGLRLHHPACLVLSRDEPEADALAVVVSEETGAISMAIGGELIRELDSKSLRNALYKYLITDLLKEELGFEGVVISDWADIMNLVDVHRVAKDEKEAVRLAVNAGMDMCMEPYDESFAVKLVELVKEGIVPISRVDDAVGRILTLLSLIHI